MPSALPALPFVAAALVLVTLPHHWRVGNIATLSIIAWLTVYDLISGINAIIWSGNADVIAPVWCDIVTKITVGAYVGLPCCCLCVAKRLNRIAYGIEMFPRGRWQRMLDIMVCWGLPMLVMAFVHYIVQGHRFDIVENIGCLSATYTSWPTIIIFSLPPMIAALLALFFCLLALSKLIRRRLALIFVFHRPNPALTPSRYIRLMAMAFFLGLWSTVVPITTSYHRYSRGLKPYVSFDFVHEDFSSIRQYTTDRIFPADLLTIYIIWGSIPLSSLPFFLLFGLSKDATKDYQACAAWVCRMVFRRSAPPILAVNTAIDSELDISCSSYGGHPGDTEKYGRESFDDHDYGPGVSLYMNKFDIKAGDQDPQRGLYTSV
ncbi:pheromone A receptor-domain-containing protein [Mycena pura]|uniref:Pheromone A receptor-domain-containing protein n=1 Tax=Mycena pura TaxID=153505 RepID=A0AAD6UP01_9AGAR|nr:pheromone A receptor-domain-containing protein [Mycena pura]